MKKPKNNIQSWKWIGSFRKLSDYLSHLDNKKGLKNIVYEKTGISKEIIDKIFDNLLRIDLLINDYMDNVYYDHDLHDKLKNIMKLKIK